MAEEKEKTEKVVSEPVSAANALEPNAGIQTVTTAPTKEVEKAGPQDPYKTETVLEKTGEEEVKPKKATQAQYDQLEKTFNEVLDTHLMDVTHKNHYLAKAGLK